LNSIVAVENFSELVASIVDFFGILVAEVEVAFKGKKFI
jgi:hypothetical protein